MIEHIGSIISNLETDLKQIDLNEDKMLRKAELSISKITYTLADLRKLITLVKFKDQSEEIHFFKVVKPTVYSKLIYFVKIFNIESRRPTGSHKSQKKYLKKELYKLEEFFTENLEFYQYVRNNMTYLDDKYFVRGIYDLRLNLNTVVFDASPDFSTSHDYKMAKVIANDLLSVYLNSEIQALNNRDKRSESKHGNVPKGKFAWSASKSALVELIYALHSAEVINDGKIDIKDVAAFFEQSFNLELGDVYRTFLEIKGRNQPSKFLDALKEALSDKINEQLN